MIKSRQEIKARAREAIREQRSVPILMLLCYWGVLIISGFITLAIGLFVSLVVTLSMGVPMTGDGFPMTARIAGGVVEYGLDAIVFLLSSVVIIGIDGACMKLYRGEKASASEMFSGFKLFSRNILAVLWMYLFLILWTLLFIIPGIIKWLAYSATYFILAESENVRPREALKLSMRITQGHKGEIFLLHLSFIGWYLLGLLTCGILIIVYVGPYHYVSMAGLYIEMRDEAIASGRITAEELE